MNKLEKLFAKAAAKKAIEKNWTAVTLRVDMNTKAELINMAAEEGKNMNQFIKDCILFKCGGNESIPSHRMEGEYEQLNDDIMASGYKCQQLENENHQLKFQLASANECDNNLIAQQAEKIADLQSAMESNNKYILQLQKEKQLLDAELDNIADKTANAILVKTAELEAEVERLKGIEIENQSLEEKFQKISTEKEAIRKEIGAIKKQISYEGWEDQRTQIRQLKNKNTKLRRFSLQVGSIILFDEKRYKIGAIKKDSFKATGVNGDTRVGVLSKEKI